MSSIPDYGAGLPAQYKTASAGDIKQLGIKKLFRMLILGPSFSGKNICMYILKHSPNSFSHLHIIARNPDQKLYRYLQDKLNGFITIHDPESPPSVDSIRKSKGNGVELVIIDDFSNDKLLMERVFSHYFTRGRHLKLSTICLIHSYFACPKMILRWYVVILKANSKRDLKMLLKDFNIPNTTEDGLIRACDQATSRKGQCLFLDSVKGEMRFNFDKPIKQPRYEYITD
ncbi:unnamed protein product [Phytophthora fragariaefolia]|uniref:Unnamed protein product n=1 Tax=Phytophthora fragariaefolia TaxID=1490495 RepID=A0A9W6YN61_9STRA|nr:unnamed protein product [Phytophthora fragariaefolia]